MRATASTKPGSISHGIAQAVQAATTAAGAPLTLDVLRATYAAAHGGTLPDTYGAMFFSLVRRGILTAVDGRASRTRYAHRDDASRFAPAEDDDDDAHAVLSALESAVAFHGRPVSTREVTQAVAELGLVLHSHDVNAVRVRLHTMSRTRVRGALGGRAPRVVLVPGATATGAPRCRWTLPGNPGGVATATSDADAMRQLVQLVCGLLGRPVTRQEVAWWCGAHPEHPLARRVRCTSLRRLLAFTLQTDRRAAASEGRLACVDDHFACWGGTPRRYHVGHVGREDQAVAVVLDLAMSLKVADEMDALQGLGRHLSMGDAAAAAVLTAARRAALEAAIVSRVTSGVAGAKQACRRAHQGLDRMREWMTAAAKNPDEAYRDRVVLNLQERHLTALATWLDDHERALPEGCPPVLVGPQSVVLPQTLDSFLAEAARELEAPLRAVRAAAFRGVRRASTERPTCFAHARDRGDVGVDRVDALLGIFALTPTSLAEAFLDDARNHLGPVLRDAATVRAALAALGASPSPLRRSLVVALGLLGETAAPETLQAMLAGPDADAAAALLGTMLADPQAVHTLTPLTGYPGLVLRRLQAGQLLSAVA